MANSQQPTANSEQPTATLDAAVREIRKAVEVQRDGRHLELLGSLRMLKDPSLSPLFSRLASAPEPAIQINGVLGLAELDPERGLDPWLVRQLGQEMSRLRAIQHAITLQLIREEDMRAMLGWDDLQEAPRLAILAEFVKRRQPIDAEQVRPLAASERAAISRLAVCLLFQIGADEQPFREVASNLASLSGDDRTRAYTEMIADIGRYRLDALFWWVEEVLDVEATNAELARLSIEAAIQLDVERGLGLWERRLSDDPSYGNSAQLGLLLFALASEWEIPADPFARLRNGHALTERLADAGAAVATGSGTVEALNALIDLDHFRSSASALFAAEDLPAADRVAVCRHAIERVEGGAARSPEGELLAVRAAALMLEADADATATFVSALDDDSRVQEVMLLGLLSCDSPHAGEVSKSIPRLGAGRADSLALVLLARHAETLSPEEFRDLGLIAAGGGRVPPSVQVQAAWLYLKHAKRIEYAISQLFAPP